MKITISVEDGCFNSTGYIDDSILRWSRDSTKELILKMFDDLKENIELKRENLSWECRTSDK